jgi:uncharacterized membrane protein YeaQ/YmgE (transglycosylase-associated protein family)
MDFLVVLAVLALQGLFVGAFARLALPGPDPLTLLQTMGIGLAGSFLAGLAVYLLAGSNAMPSLLVALVFSVGILYVIRRRRGGGLTAPDARKAEERRKRGY